MLRNALAPLTDRINIAFTYGSFARGDEQRSSDLDILVVGKVTFAEVVSAFRQAQESWSVRSTPRFTRRKNFNQS